MEEEESKRKKKVQGKGRDKMGGGSTIHCYCAVVPARPLRSLAPGVEAICFSIPLFDVIWRSHLQIKLCKLHKSAVNRQWREWKG
jgi:hypothetical protein